MPKLPTDYSKCVIYKIVCLDKTIEYTYVGSTTNFIIRKNHHKCICNNEKNKTHNLKLYTTIRDHGNWINWNMVQIEEYPCDNKREAERREEYWRVELQAQLNMRKAFCAETKEEYHKQYREKNKEEIKQYYEEHKEEINEKNKQYYEENKEKRKEQMKKYREEHKEEIKEKDRQRAKTYYHDNKVEMKEYHKKYYIKHKELFKERNKQYRDNKKMI